MNTLNNSQTWLTKHTMDTYARNFNTYRNAVKEKLSEEKVEKYLAVFNTSLDTVNRLNSKKSLTQTEITFLIAAHELPKNYIMKCLDCQDLITKHSSNDQVAEIQETIDSSLVTMNTLMGKKEFEQQDVTLLQNTLGTPQRIYKSFNDDLLEQELPKILENVDRESHLRHQAIRATIPAHANPSPEETRKDYWKNLGVQALTFLPKVVTNIVALALAILGGLIALTIFKRTKSTVSDSEMAFLTKYQQWMYPVHWVAQKINANA